MSPNAISRSQQQSKDAQITQVRALQASTQARLSARHIAMGHLKLAISKIESIGKIPALTDVHKIGDAIRFIALAMSASADLDIVELTAQADTLNEALKAANSLVTPVHING